jgi:hypothetical protein
VRNCDVSLFLCFDGARRIYEIGEKAMKKMKLQIRRNWGNSIDLDE